MPSSASLLNRVMNDDQRQFLSQSVASNQQKNHISHAAPLTLAQTGKLPCGNSSRLTSRSD